MAVVTWAPAARLDMIAIEARFDAFDPRWGAELVDGIDMCLTGLLVFPRSAPLTGHGDLRKLIVTRFAYVVSYRLRAHGIEVVSVRHARANWPPPR